jgi:hypothetical protein
MHARYVQLLRQFQWSCNVPMRCVHGLKLKLFARRKVMPDQRFYFTVLGRIDCIWAASRVEAQHKLIYSGYAPYYRYIQWI